MQIFIHCIYTDYNVLTALCYVTSCNIQPYIHLALNKLILRIGTDTLSVNISVDTTIKYSLCLVLLWYIVSRYIKDYYHTITIIIKMFIININIIFIIINIGNWQI